MGCRWSFFSRCSFFLFRRPRGRRARRRIEVGFRFHDEMRPFLWWHVGAFQIIFSWLDFRFLGERKGRAPGGRGARRLRFRRWLGASNIVHVVEKRLQIGQRRPADQGVTAAHARADSQFDGAFLPFLLAGIGVGFLARGGSFAVAGIEAIDRGFVIHSAVPPQGAFSLPGVLAGRRPPRR